MNAIESEKATFGGGCFWCTEAVFQKLRGVSEVVSGYAGGQLENPDYKSICTGSTGHAEVIQVSFDPSKIRYVDLLRVFFHIHDPTTLNRQGNDIGSQYRSVIFFHNATQQTSAKEVMHEIEQSDLWEDSLVTELLPLDVFYPAEEYHQKFFENNPTQGYCLFAIPPKLEKLERYFPELVLTEGS